jgi:hypothetical protein
LKQFIVIVVTIISIGAIVMGKVHWDNKIEASVKNEVLVDSNEVVSEVEEEVEAINEDEIMEYTTNLPEDAVSKIEEALQTGEPVHLVILGSTSSPESGGWPTLLKEKISDTYSDEVLKVTVKEIADKTSTQIISEELYDEVVNANPDILLFEPFILYDNLNVVGVNERINNIDYMLKEFEKGNPDLLVLLQPANPLYNAVNYPVEVPVLEKYAEENHYTYLNHWEAWPDQYSIEMTNYLDGLLPNESGHEVWAQYLIDYFIAGETN